MELTSFVLTCEEAKVSKSLTIACTHWLVDSRTCAVHTPPLVLDGKAWQTELVSSSVLTMELAQVVVSFSVACTNWVYVKRTHAVVLFARTFMFHFDARFSVGLVVPTDALKIANVLVRLTICATNWNSNIGTDTIR